MKSSRSATWEVYQVWSFLNGKFPIMAHYYMRGAWSAATTMEKLWLMDLASEEEKAILDKQGFRLFI